MTENEIKEYIADLRNKADILRKSGFATNGVSNHFDKSADVIEELLSYRAIGTIEEIKALKEYKAKMEMQYLDDINNPLEPLKLSSALQSEIFKYNYRKEHKPQDINPLYYTIMYALKHCLEEQMEET